MVILTDVDGVLLNWEVPFHKWMASQGFYGNGEASYQLDKCYPDLESEFVFEKIRTFNASAQMGFLEPLADARYWVRKLYRTKGITLHCITSMGDDYHARKLRVMNLENVFGKNIISRVTILGCGSSKRETLSEFEGTGMLWLEDHIGNANIGSDLGLNTFLFERPYNLINPTGKPENFTRVKNWKQLASILNK